MEPLAVGDTLQDMPLFLQPGKHIEVPLAKTYQAAFDAVLSHVHSARLSWDRVHPNQVGSMIIARAWLRAMEFEF